MYFMHEMNNFHPADLSLLPILEALIEERHVSRAALRLHRSQPAVSHALARLRDIFNDPLLVRGEGGLQPTARALQLAEPLAEALALLHPLLTVNTGFEDAAEGIAAFMEKRPPVWTGR